LGCEPLESRRLFAIAYPTPTEQYLVEVINRARANPNAEVARDATGTTFTPLSQAGWVATASSTVEAPANAIDGNVNTRWSTEANQTNGQYFQVDLGSVQSFNYLTLDAGPSTGDYPQAFSVYVSNTGTDWSTQPAVAIETGTTQLSTAGFATQSARYVRIVQTGSSSTNWWSIAELNIGTATNPSWSGAPDLNEGMPPGTITGAAQQPLAIDPYLTDAAEKHSAYGLTNAFSHTEPTASLADPTTRAVTAGFVTANSWTPFYVGENISAGTVINGDINATALNANQGLFVDAGQDAIGNGTVARGHRLQMMNAVANLVGVGVATDGATFTLTEDYNNSNLQYLTGVAYNDANGNSFFDAGEGLGGVTITATRLSDNQVFSTTTWAAGGYTLALTPGAYTVTASGGGIGTPASQTVTITTQNVEADFLPATTVTTPTAAAPTILVQPKNLSVKSSTITSFVASGPATFTAAASGTPTPSYQWQVSIGGGAYTNIAGATSGTYSYTPAATDNGNSFQCVISNAGGTVTTSAATLSLTGVGVFITTAPQSQTVNVGDTVTLTSAASGINPTVQWTSLQVGTGADYAAIAGATSPNYSFTVTPNMAGAVFFYRVTYTNTQIAGQSDQGTAIITVNNAPTAPTVTAQPVATNATAAAATTALARRSPADTTAAAGGTATLSTLYTAYPVATVQWQVSTPSDKAFTDVPDLTGASVTFPVERSMNGDVYRAVITNIAGSTTTDPVKLTVNDQSAVTNELTNLSRATAAALAAIAPCGQLLQQEGKVLTADLVRLKATKAQRALVAQLESADAAHRATLKKHEVKSLAALRSAAVRAEADDARLNKHPADASLQSKVTADLAALQADATSNPVPADAVQCNLGVDGNLAPIAAVAPSDGILQGHVATDESNADNVGQQLQSPMALALQIIARINGDL
jgi:hypothetical protein